MYRRRHSWEIVGRYLNRLCNYSYKYRCLRCGLLTDTAGRWGKYRPKGCVRSIPGQLNFLDDIDWRPDVQTITPRVSGVYRRRIWWRRLNDLTGLS